MGCDRNDGDDGNSFLALGFIGAVVPKNAVSAWGVVLSVRLENFLAVAPVREVNSCVLRLGWCGSISRWPMALRTCPKIAAFAFSSALYCASAVSVNLIFRGTPIPWRAWQTTRDIRSFLQLIPSTLVSRWRGPAGSGKATFQRQQRPLPDRE